MLFFVLTSVNAQAGPCAIFEGSWIQNAMSQYVKFEQFDIQDTQQQGVFSYSVKFTSGENSSDKGAVDCENLGNNNYKLTFHFPNFSSVNKVQLSNDYLNWSGSWGNEQSNGKSNFSRITPPPQLIEKNNKASSNTAGSNTEGSNTDGSSTGASKDNRRIYDGLVTDNCVRYMPLNRTSNQAWFAFENGCNETIHVHYNEAGAKRYFGSLMILKAGRSNKSWYLYEKYNGVNYIACKAKINGKDVHLDEDTKSCYYYK